MRVNAAFNKTLGIVGASVASGSFTPAATVVGCAGGGAGFAAPVAGRPGPSHGHHSATAVIAMICFCCGGITVELPFS